MDLVAVSGDLKRELVEFAQQPRYSRAYGQALLEQDFDIIDASEEQMVMFLDYFVLQHRLRNGKTVLEEFVAACEGLPQVQRDMLLGWREVVQGIFEVERRDGDALLVTNLIDDLPYRVRSNVGLQAIRQIAGHAFLITRLVPVGDEWLISGSVTVFRKRERDRILRIAAGFAVRHPELVFRNPDWLARGWELQREERERFVRFFGTDMVTVPGDLFAQRMGEYQAFSASEVEASLSESRPPRQAPRLVDPDSDLAESETVGVIYDELEGLCFYSEFGLVEQAFADPALLRKRLHRERVLEYLDDDSVSPLPFRRLAGRDVERANEVFRLVLAQKGFDWRRDGERLMRRRKAWFYQREPQPWIAPISDRLAPYVGQPKS